MKTTTYKHSYELEEIDAGPRLVDRKAYANGKRVDRFTFDEIKDRAISYGVLDCLSNANNGGVMHFYSRARY